MYHSVFALIFIIKPFKSSLFAPNNSTFMSTNNSHYFSFCLDFSGHSSPPLCKYDQSSKHFKMLFFKQESMQYVLAKAAFHDNRSGTTANNLFAGLLRYGTASVPQCWDELLKNIFESWSKVVIFCLIGCDQMVESLGAGRWLHHHDEPAGCCLLLSFYLMQRKAEGE